MFQDAEEEATATLLFREQADGRKVARLPSGKVVLIALDAVRKVGDGERWIVQLDHRETFAIGHPLEKVAVEGARPAPQPAAPAPAPPPSASAAGAALQPPAAVPAPSAAAPAAAPPAAPPAAKPRAAPAALDDVAALIARALAAPKRPDEVVRPQDRVALFVDGANMDGAAREAGYFLDFARAQRYLTGDGAFYAGFYFVADFTSKDPMQQRFLDFLSHNGYVVRKKAVKALYDEDTGETQYKCNLDTELVIELLNTAENYDVAFLLSGDSDYERVVDILRSRGKRVYVVASRGNLARELAYVADKPIFYLEEHRDALQREDRSPGA